MKNKKGKTIIIIILTLLVLILTGYIVYDKVFSKEQLETTKKEKVSKAKELDITSDEVTNLYNKLDVFDDSFWAGNNYYAYLFRQDSLSVDNMPDDVKVLIGLMNALQECGDECNQDMNDGGVHVSVSADKVDKQIKSILGNIEYSHVNTSLLDCSNKGYIFKDDVYTANTYGCDAGGLDMMRSDIIKATEKDNEIDIYVKVIYASKNIDNESTNCVYWDELNCTGSVSIYKGYNHTGLIENTSENIYGDGGISNKAFSKYEAHLNTYKLHFEKEDGEYHFKNIEKSR